MLNMCHYVFVQTHRIYITSEPSEELWTLCDYNVLILSSSWVKKCTILRTDADNVKSLHCPLNFLVNLKWLWKKKTLKKIWEKKKKSAYRAQMPGIFLLWVGCQLSQISKIIYNIWRIFMQRLLQYKDKSGNQWFSPTSSTYRWDPENSMTARSYLPRQWWSPRLDLPTLTQWSFYYTQTLQKA